MPNPLYTQLNNRPANNIMQILQQFQQFKNTFTGDPKAEVQKLLNSGRMTQAQYNQLSQTASQLQQLISK